MGAIEGVPPYPAVVPLSSLIGNQTGFRVDGTQPGQIARASVTGLGDFVGNDDLDDIAIGVPQTDFPQQPADGGVVYIIGGRSLLDDPFPSSFPFSFTMLMFVGGGGERAGFSVSGAGDINHDGIDDLVIGAPAAGNSNQGATYVVFGRESFLSSPIFLSTLNGNEGFRIGGTLVDGRLGTSVSRAGDFNNDGIDDLLIGSLGNVVYMIFGHETGAPLNQPFPKDVDVTQFNGQSTVKSQNGGGHVNGFRIDGAASGDSLGIHVHTAGKFNNDAYDDIILGAPNNDSNGTNSGTAYVVSGRSLPIPNNGIMQLGSANATNVITLQGAASAEAAGDIVAGGGDLNGDGRDEIVIGSQSNIYVVYGQDIPPSNLDLGQIMPSQGFRITKTASALRLAKDVNGDDLDDLDDLLIGVALENNSYVLFGRQIAPPPTILSLLDSLKGIRGYRLEFTSNNQSVGASVAAAGDVNGDGLNDLMVGAPNATTSDGGIDAGRAYV